ncbi:MAG: helix-turn-helix transcriptional regulator [Chloroflexi bacterium]|nr:helix-turn-helix transcriptional regulator [Chloroflexota bacterium]
MPEQPLPQTVAETPEQKPDPLAVNVARAVAELRYALGLSERGAAKLLHTSQTQLRRMEDPRYLPSLRSLARLAAAYGHRLVVSFEPLQRTAARERASSERPRAAARASASASPSKARKAVRGRGRAAPRARPRRAAPRRKR